MDGQRQRRAFTAAGRAVTALGESDPAGARRAAATAEELDQLGLYAAFRQLVDRSAADIERGEPVSDEVWSAMRDAVGPGPLAAQIASLSEGSGPSGGG
jgi:hypothetical protein